MLWRVQQARLTHGIRAVLWHQGESDQGSDGPTDGYGWETYQQYFLDMSAAWKQDFPNLQHYYVFQIWPNSCGMGSGHGDMLREVQRTLPRLYSNMDVMSTLGIKPPGPLPLSAGRLGRVCPPDAAPDRAGHLRQSARHLHHGAESQAGVLYQQREDRDCPGVRPAGSLDRIRWPASSIWTGTTSKVVSGAVSGNVVTLKLKETSAAKKITYLKEMNWSQDKLLIGANGIAALSFLRCADRGFIALIAVEPRFHTDKKVPVFMWEYNDHQAGSKWGLRGGSWYINDSQNYMRSTTRYDVLSAKWPNYGFRVVTLGKAKREP